MANRDYSDSESGDDGVNFDQPGVNPASSDAGLNDGPSLTLSQGSYGDDTSEQAGPSGESQHPIKITIRPSLNHLIDSPPKAKASRHLKPDPTSYPPSSDRSSLTPPPPITLKFGMKANLAAKATYSSSEGEGDEAIPRPAKKAKKASTSGGSKKKKQAVGGSIEAFDGREPGAEHEGEYGTLQVPGGSTVPAQHRKSYDWLQPSSAAASHSGPARTWDPKVYLSRPTSNAPSVSPAETPIEPAATGDKPTIKKETQAAPPPRPKKSKPKKKADGQSVTSALAEAAGIALDATSDSGQVPVPTGPGKAWRKGLKKGAGLREVLPANLDGSTSSHPGSREGSMDSDLMPPYITVEHRLETLTHVPRASSPPFVLADAKELGFPVYSKPIAAPELTLTTFPKVTQYFWPVNGGDTGPFPRREKVRAWKNSDRTIMGVGGGTLKFKSWTRGPPSELGRLIQADREARELQKLNKAKAAAQNSNNANTAQALTLTPADQSTPILGSEGTLPVPQRPGMIHSFSSDSLALGGGGGGGGGDDDGSDIDDNSSVVSGSAMGDLPIGTTPAAASPSPATKKSRVAAIGSKKAKPRKSKLAQEIVVPPLESPVEGSPAL